MTDKAAIGLLRRPQCVGFQVQILQIVKADLLIEPQRFGLAAATELRRTKRQGTVHRADERLSSYSVEQVMKQQKKQFDRRSGEVD